MQAMKYDIAVIGGGPAGMMAAGCAAQSGARVALIEKNRQLGNKLLLTGKGRCNITHAENDLRRLAEPFGTKGKFLYSAFSCFGVEEVINFFHKRGLKTKVERGNRIFPVSDSAADVRQVLIDYLHKTQVKILNNTTVISMTKTGRIIDSLNLDQTTIKFDKIIVCTGGLSYPETGSSGDGFNWAKNLGHTVIPQKPSLVPIIVREAWVKDLQGLSLKNVRVNLYQNNKKLDDRFGETLFTHQGMSGPIILDMSKHIGQLLPGEIYLYIDFKPALEHKVLDARIQRDLHENRTKMIKNSLNRLLPKKLIPVMIKLSNIDPDKKAGDITREERKKLLGLLKHFPLRVRGLAGYEKAIVTAGGISLKEIDPQTMQSKIIDNLYFAGEILDLDGPTGGYNLQLCWSTGYLAGQSAAAGIMPDLHP